MIVGHILRNRYKIVRLIGSGSFGVTYLAQDLDLPDHPLCVVKNLKQYQNPDDLQVARRLFNSEAKVLYHLGNECKQIPRLFAHFEENGEFYLVQEFIDGHDLGQEIVPGKKWTEAEVVQLLREILEVLAFVHNQNIIHRDIKAQNLMRRHTDGKIVLIDFGAVKQISAFGTHVHGQTVASVIIGTSGYMPSEQMNGYPKLSSDVYAVGMLGIYALTGIKPQDLRRDPKTFEVIWRDKASVSSKLADVLDKMVRYNFNERYQTAGEALQALAPPPPSTLISQSLLRSPSPPNQVVQELGSFQKIFISAAVGLGVLLGLGMLFMIFWKPNGSEQVTSNPAPTTPDVAPTTPDVQLVCPEPSITPLPEQPDQEIGKAKIYGLYGSELTGNGIMVFPDTKYGGNAQYDGELRQGRFNGCGSYTYGNGDRYVGQFQENLFHGTGRYVYSSCQYIGEFQKGVPNGQGIFISKNGSRYSGIWTQGQLKGSNKTWICE